MNWTKEQKQAIENKNANILVAAAAGSGKTTVLVSRIINKVIVDNVDIDKLLVVTFTNAAASEMKERLLNKLYEKIDKDPNSKNLQRQINLINRAHISTIHSFCLDVIRNNFFELGISANFRVGDETEIEIMKEEAIEKVFEDNYESENEDFQLLLNMYTSYKDDKPLKDIILKMYDFIASIPFPEKWLDDAIKDYDVKEKDFSDTKWGKIIIDYTKSTIEGYLKNLEQAKKTLEGNQNLIDFYENIKKEIVFYQTIDYSSWDKIFYQINSKEKNDWPRKSKLDEYEKELKEEAKKIRDSVKNDFEKKLLKLYSYSSDDAILDITSMKKILIIIQKLLSEFKTEFTARKREKNVVDFSDIEHLALKLLINEDGTKTEIAKKYDFEEIMCDEYQDSNLVQEQILKSVSNGHNIFMVGDVKQSIYRFREARPDLFLNKYEMYKPANGTEKELKDDTKILLYKNFRSRENVVDFVNTVFQSIMSKELGEIDYTKNEYLNFAASFDEPKIDCRTEIYVIETENQEIEEYTSKNISLENSIEPFSKIAKVQENTAEENVKEKIDENTKAIIEKNTKEKNDENTKAMIEKNTKEKIDEEIENDDEIAVDKAVLEARLIAKKIRELNQQGIEYKDIAILLRSPSVTAPVYEKELTEEGIPIFTDTSEDYLSSIEIDTIMSLLKIIDNPLQDIPLVTVMRSVIGGFSDNELIEIRLHKNVGAYYYAVKSVLEDKEESELKWKVQEFAQLIDGFRRIEKELPLDEFIWKIYSETGYYHYVRLMPNGKLRQANLRKLFEKAKEYEKISFKGIFNFITFIEKVASKKSSGFTEAKIIGENDNVVRIMSIHKSKGLEFPICIIGNAGKRFNLKDMQDKIIYDQDVGIGVNFIDKKALIEYPTLTKQAINLKARKEMISEEMRVLYVALTRAKEKLIIVGCDKKAKENIEKILSQIQSYYPVEKPEKINPSLVEKYIRYLDWIELVLEFSEGFKEQNVKFEIVNKESLKNEEKEEKSNEKTLLDQDLNKYDKEKYKKVDELLTWKYPKEISEDIPGKTSVTALKNQAMKINEDGKLEIISENLDENEEQKITNRNINKNATSANINNDNLKEENEIEKSDINNNTKIKKFILDEKDEKLKANEKGSLIHLVMQKIENCNIEETIEKLTVTEKEKRFLLENKSIIESYLKSDLFKELQEAKEIHKEEAFYMNVEYKHSDVLVQGVIDLYYINKNDELILVDYKTDRNINDAILKERYKNQLLMYKTALEKSLKRKVDKTYIYSTELNKEVKIY